MEEIVENLVHVDKEIKRTILQPRRTELELIEIVEEVPVYYDEIHEKYIEKVS